METFLRTVDVNCCIYPFGRAISHDKWEPHQVVRIAVDEKGHVINRGVYDTFKKIPDAVHRRIKMHLNNRTDPHRGDDCPVIDAFDTDGFEDRRSRILDFKKARLQRMIEQKEKFMAIDRDSTDKRPSSIEKAMRVNPIKPEGV